MQRAGVPVPIFFPLRRAPARRRAQCLRKSTTSRVRCPAARRCIPTGAECENARVCRVHVKEPLVVKINPANPLLPSLYSAPHNPLCVQFWEVKLFHRLIFFIARYCCIYARRELKKKKIPASLSFTDRIVALSVRELGCDVFGCFGLPFSLFLSI